MDRQHIEAAPTARLGHAAQEGGVIGVQPADQDVRLGVYAADHDGDTHEQRGVGGNIGGGTPEERVVRLHLQTRRQNSH